MEIRDRPLLALFTTAVHFHPVLPCLRRPEPSCMNLHGRLLPRLLAPARGVPGRACAPRGIGMDQSRAGGRAAGSQRTPGRPFLRPVGRAQPRPRRPRRGRTRPPADRGLNPRTRERSGFRARAEPGGVRPRPPVPQKPPAPQKRDRSGDIAPECSFTAAIDCHGGRGVLSDTVFRSEEVPAGRRHPGRPLKPREGGA